MAKLKNITKTTETTTVVKEKSNESFGMKAVRQFMRLGGVVSILLSLVLYAQVLPLAFVFIGTFLGIPADVSDMTMDLMIWLMTGAAFGALSVWLMVQIIKTLWTRLVMNPPNPFAIFQK